MGGCEAHKKLAEKCESLSKGFPSLIGKLKAYEEKIDKLEKKTQYL